MVSPFSGVAAIEVLLMKMGTSYRLQDEASATLWLIVSKCGRALGF